MANYSTIIMTIFYCATEPTDEPVGFTAHASDGNIYYNTDDILIFDSTATNIGGYYDTSSWQFLCPADGMYAFSFSALTTQMERFYGSIMKESTQLVSVFGETAGTSGFNNGVTNFVITACSKGERVWIRCLGDGHAIYDNSNRYTTFSGVLLQRF